MPGEAQAIQAGLGIAAGAAQFFDSLAKEKKAKEELKRLKQPFYKIQDEYFQNRNMAGVLAGGGMPAASKDYYTTESHRGLGASISAVLQGGGDPSGISRVFDVYNRSIDRTTAMDAEQQIKNIQYFMGVNKDLAGQKTMKWALDEYQPYQNKLKEITQRRAAAERNKWEGIQTAIGSTGAFATSQQNNDLGGWHYKRSYIKSIISNGSKF